VLMDPLQRIAAVVESDAGEKLTRCRHCNRSLLIVVHEDPKLGQAGSRPGVVVRGICPQECEDLSLT
jgi:hypothetical protein